MVAVLLSALLLPQPAKMPAHTAALPPLQSWREPHEQAYTLSVPRDWHITGGISRADATHAADGVEATSPDGLMTVRLGDPRFLPCVIAAAGLASMPQGGKSGMLLCHDATPSAANVGQRYVTQALGQDLRLADLQITSTVPREDLAHDAEAAATAMGRHARCTAAELHFKATLHGAPVTGMTLAQTMFVPAAPGQNAIQGTVSTEVRSIVGPPGTLPMLARLAGAMESSLQYDPQWYAQHEKLSLEATRAALLALRKEGEQERDELWNRTGR